MRLQYRWLQQIEESFFDVGRPLRDSPRIICFRFEIAVSTRRLCASVGATIGTASVSGLQMASTLSPCVTATTCDLPRFTLETRRLGRRAASIVAAGTLLLAIVTIAVLAQLAAGISQRPPVAAPTLREPWRDATPLTLTMTVDWTKILLTVRADQVRYPGGLWRHMHFDDWDQLPDGIRTDALNRMVDRYEAVFGDPAVWDRMTAVDWDDVPQPIRAMAYIQMLRYWSGHYQVGRRHELPRGTVANTLCAIVMVESWFEHRAESRSRSGNRDLGLAQASDGTRAALARLQDRGLIDFAPAGDDSYFDPWQAARVVAIWFELMLRETGDLAAAIRAYHVGAPAALLGEGEAYRTAVEDKRKRFIANQASTPAWDLLYRRVFASLPASSDTTGSRAALGLERATSVQGAL
jgi:hypothetical protein